MQHISYYTMVSMITLRQMIVMGITLKCEMGFTKSSEDNSTEAHLIHKVDFMGLHHRYIVLLLSATQLPA